MWATRSFPGVVRGSLRRGWLQTGVVVSGDALVCTDVRPRVDVISIKEGWLSRARGWTSRHGDTTGLSSKTNSLIHNEIRNRHNNLCLTNLVQPNQE